MAQKSDRLLYRSRERTPAITVDVDVLEGIVLEVQRWAANHIETFNGRGYLHDSTARLVSVEKARVFIQCADGSETTAILDERVGFRIGHRVRIISVQRHGGASLLIGVANLDTGSYASFDFAHEFFGIWPSRSLGAAMMAGRVPIWPPASHMLLCLLAAFGAPFTLGLSLIPMFVYFYRRNKQLTRFVREGGELLSQGRADQLARLEAVIDQVKGSGSPVTLTLGS